jgi:hypothetical protein
MISLECDNFYVKIPKIEEKVSEVTIGLRKGVKFQDRAMSYIKETQNFTWVSKL